MSKTPSKKIQKLSDDAKNVKRFIRLDVGGRDIHAAVYKYIDDNILTKGGSMGKLTKQLTAAAIISFANSQLGGVRSRTKSRLDSIITVAAGK
jgi:hypothetical protein